MQTEMRLASPSAFFVFCFAKPHIAIPLSPFALIRFLGAWMDRDRKQIYIWACVLLTLILYFYFHLYFTMMQLGIGDQPIF